VTTILRPTPAPLLQVLRRVGRRWRTSPMSERSTRPRPRPPLCHGSPLPPAVWAIDRADLQAALDRSWR
jgi:hypothetical protein